MKLLFTRNSPYARRARIAVREAGLLNEVEELDISPREENLDTLLAYSPAAKVPVLVTSSGYSIYESILIGRYIDEQSGNTLMPSDAHARDTAMALDATASALLDSLFVRSRENRRDPSEQSPGVIALEAERAGRLLDTMETMIPAEPYVNLGVITAACALGYADWRHPGDGWRNSHPRLSAWFDAIHRREAFKLTAPEF